MQSKGRHSGADQQCPRHQLERFGLRQTACRVNNAQPGKTVWRPATWRRYPQQAVTIHHNDNESGRPCDGIQEAGDVKAIPAVEVPFFTFGDSNIWIESFSKSLHST